MPFKTGKPKKILSFNEFKALTEGDPELWFLDGMTKKEFASEPIWKIATWSATAKKNADSTK